MNGAPTLPPADSPSPTEARWLAFRRRAVLSPLDPGVSGDHLRLVCLEASGWRAVDVSRTGARPTLQLHSSADSDPAGRTLAVDDHGWRGVERVMADEELWWTSGPEARGNGPLWVLERVRAHHHHRRWSTEPLGEAFGDACRFLSELAGDTTLLRRLDSAARHRFEEVSF